MPVRWMLGVSDGLQVKARRGRRSAVGTMRERIGFLAACFWFAEATGLEVVTFAASDVMFVHDVRLPRPTRLPG